MIVFKKQKSLFDPLFGDLLVTYELPSIVRWKAGLPVRHN